MNANDKGVQGDSYEGHGISVSECPDDWERIAGLGGLPRWEIHALPRSELRFLDLHAINDGAMDSIRAWAVEEGLVTPARGFKVSWYDEDHQGFSYTVFLSEADAQAEFESHASMSEPGETPEDEHPKFDVFDGHALTPAALSRLRRTRAGLDETDELCALLYIEDATDLTGAYWEDRYAPESLSAPRAVILPSRMSQLRISPEGSTNGESLVEAVSSLKQGRIQAALENDPNAAELHAVDKSFGGTPLFYLLNSAMLMSKGGFDEAGVHTDNIASCAHLILDAGGTCKLDIPGMGASQIFLDEKWHRYGGAPSLEGLMARCLELGHIDPNAPLLKSGTAVSELPPLAAAVVMGNNRAARLLLDAGADPDLAAKTVGFGSLIDFATDQEDPGAALIGAMLAQHAMMSKLSRELPQAVDPAPAIARRAKI